MTNAVSQVQQRTNITTKLAQRFSIDEEKLIPILKATAFKVRDGQVSNEQMTALMVVSDQYGLNPFTKELYAYPDKSGGIVPVVSVDGWSRIINENPALNGIEFRYSEKTTKPSKGKECPEWCEAIIHRKDRAQPTVVREYLDEVFRDLSYANPWQTHTKRMLRHKALIQCARMAFGFGGVYDQDEAERIMEMDITPITPTAGVLASLPAKTQTAIIETANQVKALLREDNPMDAYALWQDSRFDADQHVAFWSLLDSKQRAVLDRLAQAERASEPVVIDQPPAEQTAAKVITAAQHKRLEARITEVGIDREKVKKYVKKTFGLDHFTEMNKDQYDTIDQMLTDYVPKKSAAKPEPTIGDRIAACKTVAELDALSDGLSEDDVGIYYDAVAKRKGELSEGGGCEQRNKV